MNVHECREDSQENLSSSTLMLAGSQTQGLTEKPIIIILGK